MNPTEFKIVDQLDRIADIQDVYFHKGTLYVVNEYDMDKVETFLNESGYDVFLKSCDEEVTTY